MLASVQTAQALRGSLVGVGQRHVAEAITAALDPRSSRADEVEHTCRLLLVADRFAVAHLRAHCLRCLAVMFERLSSSTAPADVREVFEVSKIARACVCMSNSLQLLLEMPISHFMHH